MAGGWARDGAVQDQIDDSIADAVLSARSSMPMGESETHCVECGEPIPERRRTALPGVRTCVACQSLRDAKPKPSAFNRRGARTASSADHNDRDWPIDDVRMPPWSEHHLMTPAGSIWLAGYVAYGDGAVQGGT